MKKASILGIGLALGLMASPALAADKQSPIFGDASTKVLSKSDSKKVVGKGYYADYYGYYGNLYGGYALENGYYGDTYDTYDNENYYYYYAYYWSYYSYVNYYYAYLYAGT